MKKALLTLVLIVAFIPAGHAVDADFDALDDGDINTTDLEFLERADIGVIDTGDGSVANFVDRLTNLGYSVMPIPDTSDYSVLSTYSLIILPVGHAGPSDYLPIEANAADYVAYVQSGGGLWVSQPNPFGRPGDTADITWVPYQLTVQISYNAADCPPCIVDDTSCIIIGTGGDGLSFPGDTVISMGPEWNVVAEGCVTGNPAIFTADYGAGHVLVELGHPSPGAICSPSDVALATYADCTWGSGQTPAEDGSWSRVKSLY
jgi:hypothetical protein